MINLYIDADSCPVKEEALRVAERYNLEVYMVANSGLRPINNPKVHMIQVSAGADAADDWIAERITENEITITADILLAQRCLEQKAYAINPNGNAFTNENIGSAVMGRSINAHLREIGESTKHNPSFSKQDRSRFLQTLDATIQTVMRTTK